MLIPVFQILSYANQLLAVASWCGSSSQLTSLKTAIYNNNNNTTFYLYGSLKGTQKTLFFIDDIMAVRRKKAKKNKIVTCSELFLYKIEFIKRCLQFQMIFDDRNI